MRRPTEPPTAIGAPRESNPRRPRRQRPTAPPEYFGLGLPSLRRPLCTLPSLTTPCSIPARHSTVGTAVLVSSLVVDLASAAVDMSHASRAATDVPTDDAQPTAVSAPTGAHAEEGAGREGMEESKEEWLQRRRDEHAKNVARRAVTAAADAARREPPPARRTLPAGHRWAIAGPEAEDSVSIAPSAEEAAGRERRPSGVTKQVHRARTARPACPACRLTCPIRQVAELALRLQAARAVEAHRQKGLGGGRRAKRWNPIARAVSPRRSRGVPAPKDAGAWFGHSASEASALLEQHRQRAEAEAEEEEARRRGEARHALDGPGAEHTDALSRQLGGWQGDPSRADPDTLGFRFVAVQRNGLIDSRVPKQLTASTPAALRRATSFAPKSSGAPSGAPSDSDAKDAGPPALGGAASSGRRWARLRHALKGRLMLGRSGGRPGRA